MQNYNSCFGDLLDLHGDCDDIEDSGGGGGLLGVDAVPPVQQSYQDIKAPQSSILLRSCGDNPLTTLFFRGFNPDQWDIDIFDGCSRASCSYLILGWAGG